VIAARLEIDAALRQLPGEERVPVDLAAEHRCHRDAHHDGESDAVVGGQLEHHDHGRERGAEDAGGDRAHAEDGIDAGIRAERGEQGVGDHAERRAHHGAERQARTEDAAREVTAQAQRGRRPLGERQDQHELQLVLVAQHAIGRLVAHPQHLGQPQRHDADRSARQHRPQPERQAEAFMARLDQRDRAHQGDRRDGADEAQKHEGRELQERDDLLRRQDEGRIGADVDAGDHRAEHRADHHRRERAEPIVTDHHLEREDHAGDRRVERARDRRGDAAAQKCLGERGRQLRSPGDEARECRTEMHDRALAADRGAAAE